MTKLNLKDIRERCNERGHLSLVALRDSVPALLDWCERARKEIELYYALITEYQWKGVLPEEEVKKVEQLLAEIEP